MYALPWDTCRCGQGSLVQSIQGEGPRKAKECRSCTWAPRRTHPGMSEGSCFQHAPEAYQCAPGCARNILLHPGGLLGLLPVIYRLMEASQSSPAPSRAHRRTPVAFHSVLDPLQVYQGHTVTFSSSWGTPSQEYSQWSTLGWL